MVEQFLQSSKLLFEYYKSLGDKSFDQLSEGDIHWRYNRESNSIAIIVNHLQGNMKSRWTDFLIADGEKEWRDRDREFEAIINTKEDLLQRWEEGWACLFDALESVRIENFNTPIYIRNKEHSITAAIHRQIAHYAYHIGQIIAIAKMIKGDLWTSLTIPKYQSSDYNKNSFAKGKRKEHFTEQFLKNKSQH